MKLQKYFCPECKNEKVVEVSDECVIQYVPCRRIGCIRYSYAGMRLINEVKNE